MGSTGITVDKGVKTRDVLTAEAGRVIRGNRAACLATAHATLLSEKRNEGWPYMRYDLVTWDDNTTGVLITMGVRCRDQVIVKILTDSSLGQARGVPIGWLDRITTPGSDAAQWRSHVKRYAASERLADQALAEQAPLRLNRALVFSGKGVTVSTDTFVPVDATTLVALTANTTPMRVRLYDWRYEVAETNQSLLPSGMLAANHVKG